MRVRLVSAQEILSRPRGPVLDLGGPLANKGRDAQQEAARKVSRPIPGESDEERERRVSAWMLHLAAEGAYIEMLTRRGAL